MRNSPDRDQNARRRAGIALVVFGLLVFAAGAVFRASSPKLYTAAVRLECDDPYLRSFERFEGPEVLGCGLTGMLRTAPVDRCGADWPVLVAVVRGVSQTNRSVMKAPLSPAEAEAVRQLRRGLHFQLLQPPPLWEMRVCAEGPDECVGLAWAVAEACVDYGKWARRTFSMDSIHATMRACEGDGNTIKKLQNELWLLEQALAPFEWRDAAARGSSNWFTAEERSRHRQFLDRLQEDVDHYATRVLSSTLPENLVAGTGLVQRLERFSFSVISNEAVFRSVYLEISNRIATVTAKAKAKRRPVTNRYWVMKRHLEGFRPVQNTVLLRFLQEQLDAELLTRTLVQIIDPVTIIRGPWRRSQPFDWLLMSGGLLVILFGLLVRSRAGGPKAG